MGNKADEDPDKLIISSNSTEIQTIAHRRPSIDSQVSGYSGSNRRRDSGPLGLDEGARRLRKGSGGDGLEEGTPANTEPSWDNHFVPVDGRRVSVLTNASYALAKTSPHIGLGGCIMVVVGCVLGSGNNQINSCLTLTNYINCMIHDTGVIVRNHTNALCYCHTGIFAAPDAILSQLTSASLALIVWVAFGVIALISALCYVELGLTFPVSGGDYAYLNECFGPVAGFLFQWADNLLSMYITIIDAFCFFSTCI